MGESRICSLTRPAASVVLLAIVLAGCGDARSGADEAATPPPPTTRASTPGPTKTSTAASPNAAGIPDDFPLAQGLVADGDTTVSPPRHDVRGVELEPRCWDSVWPGAAVDRLVVQQVGPELGVTRELALYPDARAAAAVAEQVRVNAAHCHRLPATSLGAAMDVTRLGDVDTGLPDVTASFAETPTGGQPGGSVFVFTQVGRAILAVQDSGEWTRDSSVDGARHLHRADRDVVSRLCVFSRAGC